MFKKVLAFAICLIMIFSVSAFVFAENDGAETSEKETNWVEVLDPTYPTDETESTTLFSDETLESYSAIGDDIRDTVDKGFNFFDKINQFMEKIIEFFNGLFERLQNVKLKKV